MIERDYIMRLVQQLAGVLMRIFKLKTQEEYEHALEETHRAYQELLGMSPELMAAFDSAALAQLLGHHEKVKAAAALFREESELYRRTGDTTLAQARAQRACELYLEAIQRQTRPDAECVAAVKFLVQFFPIQNFSVSYTDLLQKLAP